MDPDLQIRGARSSWPWHKARGGVSKKFIPSDLTLVSKKGGAGPPGPSPRSATGQNCYQIERNNNYYKNQLKRKTCLNDIVYTKEGTDGQILRSSKWIVIVNCNYDFWKFVSLTVFQISFCNVNNAWQTYLSDLKQWFRHLQVISLLRISVTRTLKTRKDGLGVSGENVLF